MGERLFRGSKGRVAQRSKILYFFTKITSFFRAILIKIDTYEMWHKNYRCKNIIKLVAYQNWLLNIKILNLVNTNCLSKTK